MRTTLTIDDDVLLAIKDRARLEQKTAGQVASELMRQALTGPPLPASNDEDDRDGDEFERIFGFRPLPRRSGAVITNEMVRRLRDEDPYA